MKTIKSRSLLYAIGCALFVGSTAAHAANSYSGRAFIAQVKVLGLIDVVLVDTGLLPSTGGVRDASLPTLSLLGLTADLVHARTKTGEAGQLATSFARATKLGIDLSLIPALPLVGGLLGGLLDASGLVVRARSRARCVDGSPQLIGRSVVTDLVVLGISIDVTGEPNQVVDVLGLAQVIINEQVRSFGPGNTGAITVNAVRIKVLNTLAFLPPVADVIVASAHSDITCD